MERPASTYYGGQANWATNPQDTNAIAAGAQIEGDRVLSDAQRRALVFQGQGDAGRSYLNTLGARAAIVGQQGQAALTGLGQQQTELGTVLGQQAASSYGQAGQTRGQQLGLANAFGQYAQQAAAPSVALAQANADQNAAFAQRLGTVGAGGPSVMRQALGANANQQGQIANAAAANRVAEQNIYRGQRLQGFAGQNAALASVRDQDINQAYQQGQLGQQYSTLGSNAALQGYNTGLAGRALGVDASQAGFANQLKNETLGANAIQASEDQKYRILGIQGDWNNALAASRAQRGQTVDQARVEQQAGIQGAVAGAVTTLAPVVAAAAASGA